MIKNRPNCSSLRSLSQGWSEDDPGEESDMESPEQLREAVHHHSSVTLPDLQFVANSQKMLLARSPAVQSLGDLLDIKTREVDEVNMILPNKITEVMSSTMLVDSKQREEDIVEEDISVIKTRESLDPRLSGQPCRTEKTETIPVKVLLGRKRGDQEQLGVSDVSNLSSSLGLANSHSTEPGGSMVMPRVIREMVAIEKGGKTEVAEVAEITCNLADGVVPTKQSHQNTINPSDNISVDLDQMATTVSQPKTPDNPPEPQLPDTDTILIPDSDPGPVPTHHPHVCQYPPPPHAGAVCVTVLDYQTLNRGTFLNDVIIDFYSTYLYSEMLTQEQREKVFIFSSCFFKRLSTDPVEGSMMATLERESKLSLSQVRHKRVSSWTKTVNLSTKQLVIFPICKDSHWFLVTAVLTGEKSFLVVMDSLGGVNKDVVDMIKEYLVIEMSNKMGDTSLQVVKEMKVSRPSLPHQDNYTDCGLFLLHYVEKMLERPNEMLCLGDQDLVNWFPRSEVNLKRSKIAKLVKKLAEEQILSGHAPTFPDLFGEEQEKSRDAKVATFEEEDPNKDYLINIIKAELSNLSPTASRSVSSSKDTSREIFSSVSPSTQATPTSGPSKKRLKLANTRQAERQMSLFTKAEYYRGKPSSERKFDEFLEEWEKEKKGKEDELELFSQ